MEHRYGCPKFGDSENNFEPCRCLEIMLEENFPVQESVPVQESKAPVTDITIGLEPTIENPLPVRSVDGRLLGSAVLTLGQGRIYLRFLLDPHNPESFDLAQEPNRCRVGLDATLKDGVLAGTVTLLSK